MFEGIRDKIIIKHGTKRMGARWLATPTFTERLEESKKWSRPCIAKKTADDLFQVSMSEDRIYAAHFGPMDVEGGI
jgi:hypothetical protein